MKRIFALLVLTCLLLMTVACGSTKTYTVQRNNGPDIVSVAKPDYDEKSGTYTLEDMDGNDMVIKRENVISIQEHQR